MGGEAQLTMYHVTLSSLAGRVLEHGLDEARFPGRTRTLRGQARGNFLWETLAQAEAWREELERNDGGSYEFLAVDTDGIELVRDPAIGQGSWFAAQPITAERIRLI